MAEIFQKYMGTGLMLIWFILSLLYLFFKEKRKPFRILFVYTPAIVLLLFFNPLFYHLFQVTVDTEIYFRLCWLLPITSVIAYAIVHVCTNLQATKRQKAGLICTAIILLLASGTPVYKNPLYTPAENAYHVPQAVVDICDAIKIEGREIMAAFPTEFLLYVRQYSPVICMPYGRETYTGLYNELHELIMSEEIDVKHLSALSKASYCHYLILEEGKTFLGDMTAYGYELFDTMHGYEIYKDTTMNFNLY